MLSHIGIDAANLQPSAFDKKVKICPSRKKFGKTKPCPKIGRAKKGLGYFISFRRKWDFRYLAFTWAWVGV